MVDGGWWTEQWGATSFTHHVDISEFESFVVAEPPQQMATGLSDSSGRVESETDAKKQSWKCGVWWREVRAGVVVFFVGEPL